MITFYELGNLGRLGNQMFQYAALRGLCLESGYDCKLPDLSSKTWHGQDCLLPELNIIDNPLTDADLSKIRFQYNEQDAMRYDNQFFNTPDNTNLSGFFQSIKYFQNHQDSIKKELTPKTKYLDKAAAQIAEIKNRYPGYDIVSLHIRRGDNTDSTDPSQYKLRNFYNPGGGFDQYLQNATKIFEGRKVKFLIFTGGKRWVDDNYQDIQWCRERLNGDDFLFSPGSSTIEDFCLIMQSDHNIISHVSSFGWWAAFLRDSPDKITVAPNCYHPDIDNFSHREGFYPSQWTLV